MTLELEPNKVKTEAVKAYWRLSAHQEWIKSTGVPLYRGYYQPDLRKLKLGWWEERGCNAAFLLLAGQEQVSEARVTEIPPGGTLPPFKFALDEIVYVLQGRGSTSIKGKNGVVRSFEWEGRSLFRMPRHHYYQFSNLHGSQPARLLHYNYLPCAMAAMPNPDYYFNNDRFESDIELGQGLYAEARAVKSEWEDIENGRKRSSRTWVGNFFPDMAIWDKHERSRDLRDPRLGSVQVHFPDSPLLAHMSVFPPGTYRKAHRHGPGYAIVIPDGEGYSRMFEQGKEAVICPWSEASLFVPPDQWFHQHFNVGAKPMRYLALHPPAPFARYERINNPDDEIDYMKEDPAVRKVFAEELAKRGLQPHMPEQVYTDPSFIWEDKASGD